MSKPHQGDVRLVTEFDKAWEFLTRTGERSLQTDKNGIAFIATVRVAGKGIHSGQRAIVFLQNKTRKISAYAYECCWGHHTNCYGKGTRIGMYCKALDESMTFIILYVNCYSLGKFPFQESAVV